MLKEDDFQRFVELSERIDSVAGTYEVEHPDSTLYITDDPDALHRSELRRLVRSLEISHFAGDIPNTPHLLLDAITSDLKQDSYCYRPLSHTDAWFEALRWAVSQPRTFNLGYTLNEGKGREFVVGTACKELRERGFSVDIGTNGPEIDSEVRTAIARSIDGLIAEMGGAEVISQLCWLIRHNHRLHDGMWLLGSLPSRANQRAVPWIPVGWLVSIALRHTRRASPAVDPASSWQNVVKLATLFATSMDCQSYSQFDGVNIKAPEFFPKLAESLVWRELFTLPQIPASVPLILREAFDQVVWPSKLRHVGDEVEEFIGEFEHLHACLIADQLVEVPNSIVRSSFPLLWKHAKAPETGVNSGYLDPFGSEPRDQDRFIFFDRTDESVLVLPSPLATANACEALFRMIWGRAGSAAAQIVGDSIEKCVAIACGRHGGHVWEKEKYRVRDKQLEIDVAVRDGDEIVLFETKAKSLSGLARTGDMMAFTKDLTKSFITLLGQLVQHDRNLRLGVTPLTGHEDDFDELRITKVAVSPLSYGPLSDHTLLSSLFQSIVAAKFSPMDENAAHREILTQFNEKVDKIVNDMTHIDAQKNSETDLFVYLLDVFWLDLGQLLYSLERGKTIPQSVAALRNLTFSTHDFWTEAALADRQSLTKEHWHPPSVPASN